MIKTTDSSIRHRVGMSSLSGIILVGVAVSACTSASGPDLQRSVYPRLATYDCGGERLTVVNERSQVTVTGPGAEDGVTLPPAPAGQFNRYSEDLYTLVLDRGSAFWYKTGNRPRDCRRVSP